MTGSETLREVVRGPQIRIAHCVFQPGGLHVLHSHPGYFTYVLGGGKGQIQDEKGTRQVAVRADTYTNSAPIPWHELTNTGDTPLRYLVIERK
jgi:mannose-6-phosphate isomerase-like protein (cupin superfamily)